MYTYIYIYIRTHKSKLEDYKALHFFCVSEGAKFLNRRELQPKFSKGSKGGMKVGGIFPIKSPYIRDPSSYLPSSHLLRPPKFYTLTGFWHPEPIGLPTSRLEGKYVPIGSIVVPFWDCLIGFYILLMDKILHDLKDSKLWELWYILYNG